MSDFKYTHSTFEEAVAECIRKYEFNRDGCNFRACYECVSVFKWRMNDGSLKDIYNIENHSIAMEFPAGGTILFVACTPAYK